MPGEKVWPVAYKCTEVLFHDPASAHWFSGVIRRDGCPSWFRRERSFGAMFTVGETRPRANPSKLTITRHHLPTMDIVR